MSDITRPKRAIYPVKEKPKKAQKSLPKDQHPFREGDFVMEHREDRLRRVGKCTVKSFELLVPDDDGNWTEHYTTVEWKDLGTEYKRYLKLDKPIDEYEKEALHHLSTGFSELRGSQEMSDSTDLVATSDKTYAKTLKSGLLEKQKHVMLLQSTLNRMMRDLDSVISDMREKIKAVSRVVDVIEIYLGVHEQIVQIQEGEPAGANEPIVFRQLVLHMDEETAEDIDFRDIDLFDQFMRDHTDQILPERRGVVVCRPRATDKTYDPDNPLMNHLMNEANRETYILIRNGDNLYRIYTSVVIYPHLFPSPSEMRDLLNTTGEWGYKEREAQDSLHQYKRNVLLLQGLLDRTQVFHPIAPGLNLLKPDTYGNHLRFIYDGSDLLPSGRKSWHEYLKDMNQKLQRGDRVYMAEIPWGALCRSDNWRSPLTNQGWSQGEGYSGERPPQGIYTIKEVRKTNPSRYSEHEVRTFLINFRKKGERYDRQKGYVERKKAIPFYLTEEDGWILNYELIRLDDIDFYLSDRVNRREYKTMMPVLRGIRKQRLEEIEWEKAFVKLVAHKLGREDQNDLIWDVVGWWKRKVIEKRPLKKEDAKALRMVLLEVKRRLKDGKNDSSVRK